MTMCKNEISKCHKLETQTSITAPPASWILQLNVRKRGFL